MNLFTIIFGTLIIGLGYVGLLLRYLFIGKIKEFYLEFPIFDKIIQSIILGTISFIFNNAFFIKIKDISQEKEILNYIINNPTIFLYQFLFIIIIIYGLFIFELYLKLISFVYSKETILKLKKIIQEFNKKRKKKIKPQKTE